MAWDGLRVGWGWGGWVGWVGGVGVGWGWGGVGMFVLVVWSWTLLSGYFKVDQRETTEFGVPVPVWRRGHLLI